MNATAQCVTFDDTRTGECVADAQLVAGQCVYSHADYGTGLARTDAPPWAATNSSQKCVRGRVDDGSVWPVRPSR